MLPLMLGGDLDHVLVIGSHADDIEIGCGGTVIALALQNPELAVSWVVLAARDGREAEARASAAAFLGKEPALVEIHSFRDGYLPADRAAVKDVFEKLKGSIDPQLVLTHCRDDSHQDHRLACELTWNTFRDHLILEYEIPKWDGDLGRPNAYLALDSDIVDRKIELLLRQFPSQTSKPWFDPETFRSLLRLRGVECGARYAEAFTARKLVFR